MVIDLLDVTGHKHVQELNTVSTLTATPSYILSIVQLTGIKLSEPYILQCCLISFRGWGD